MKKLNLFLGSIAVATTLFTGCGSSTSDDSTTTVSNIITPKVQTLNAVPHASYYDSDRELIYFCLDDGTVGIYDVNNTFNMISKLNLDMTNNYNRFCGSITVDENNNSRIYALNADGYGLFVGDVSNPTSPKLITTLDEINDNVNVHVPLLMKDNYLLISTRKYDGKFNIRDTQDSNYTEIYSELIQNSYLPSSTITPDKNRYFIYYVDTGSGERYIDVKDISDVYHVSSLGVNAIGDDSIFKIKALSNDYMVGATYDEIIFYNISDSSNIYKTVTIKNPHYNSSYRDFAVDGNYIYALASDTSHGVFIDKIDISDTNNPKIVSSKEINGDFESRMLIAGDYIYLYYGAYDKEDVVDIIKKSDI